MRKQKRWPTPDLPPAPVSVQTHGPVCNWTDEQWAAWRKWAISLKDYPGERPDSGSSDNAGNANTNQQ